MAPEATTAYELVAVNALGDSVAAEVTVTVVPPAAIASFGAQPDTIMPGDTARLAWSVEDADAVFVGGADVTDSTHLEVAPEATTTYGLVAVNVLGDSAAAEVTVTVVPPATIASFGAQPDTIMPGDTARLTWSVADAESVILDGADVTDSTQLEVAPEATTTYELVAVNVLGDSVMAEVTVTVAVNNPPVAHIAISGCDAGSYNCTYDASGSTDPEDNIESYSWAMGDGTVLDGATVAHGYGAPGRYTVTLTVTDSVGVTDTADTVRVVNLAPEADFTAACEELACTFTSTTTDDGGIETWAWDFGDGDSGTGEVATHTYATRGTYTVTLTVTDAGAAADTASQQVRVNTPPVASFAVACDGYACSFDASASTDDDGIASHAWTTGDGTSLSGATASHTYAAHGTYTVTLTVTDADAAADTASQQVSVNTPPEATFTFECDGYACHFDATGSTDDNGIQSHAWTTGDGTSLSGATASHTYAAHGTYTVTLTVTDTDAATDSVAQEVEANRRPVASFTFECDGYSCHFDAASSTDDDGIVSYLWEFDDQTPLVGGDTVTHVFAAHGTYAVSLLARDTGGLSGSVKILVLANEPPEATFTASCDDYTCTFNGSTSTDDDRIRSYSWNFGDGTTGTGPTASHTYAAYGTNSVTLTVTDTDDETDSATRSVLANRGPTARFSVSCDDYTCSFNASGSTDDDGVASYAWNFGDGTTGTGQTASHTYAVGTYTITLTATDTDGATGTVTRSITVTEPNEPPTARFTYSCNGYACTFNASGSTDDDGIASYAWNFGDGTTGTGQTASRTYAAHGTYSVTLTVTDTDDATDSATRSVLANRGPAALFTVSCDDYTCSFNASGSTDDDGIASYAWNFGDGTTGTGQTASRTYAAYGTYRVTLTVTDTDDATDSATRSVLANRGPTARFTASCNGYACTFNASGSTDDDGISSYAWNFGDGTTSTGQTASRTYAAYGTYRVTLTVTDTDGETDGAARSVLANQGPTAHFTVSCDDYTCSFNASGSTDDDGVASYAWNFGDGTTGTGQTASHTYPVGTYTITLTATDTDGATGTVTRSITVTEPNEPPTARFTYSCNGYACTFNASGSTDDDGIASYAWNFGDGTTGTGQTASRTYAAHGTYSVTLTVTDTDDATDSATRSVLANRGPAALFTVSCDDYTCSFNASGSTDDDGIASYAWNFGDGTTGTGQTASRTYAAYGTYRVTLTVTDTDDETDSTTRSVLANRGPTARFTASCNGYACTFNASGSTDDDGISSYAWNFGDGTTSTGQTASRTYAAYGTYRVTLTVTDTDGETDGAARSVLANQGPTAHFTVSCDDYTCSFNGSTSTDDDGISSYAWNFGDGTTGTGQTASRTYAEGTYTITLTVTDTDGATGTLSQSITLTEPNEPPTARFTYNCNGYACGFSASGSTDDDGISSYAWNFGDRTTGSGVNTNRTYLAHGTYSVTLTVTDTDGEKDSATRSVLANRGPTASFTASCHQYTCEFNGSGSSDDDGITNYRWDFGDNGVAASDTASHTYASGTYTVTLTVTDTDGETGSTTRQVVIGRPPVASFTAECHGFDCTFNASGSSDPEGGSLDYDWDFGDGTNGTGPTPPIHTYASGTYTVTLTVTDTDGETGSTTRQVVIGRPPVASFTAECHGFDCTFNASGSSDPEGGSLDYDWDFGDGTNGTGPTPPIHTYASGTYTVTLTVTDNDWMTHSTTRQVVIGRPPVASFTAECHGFDCTFNASGSSDPEGGSLDYDWDFGDGTNGTGPTPPIHTYASGTYTVTLTVTDNDWMTHSTTRQVVIGRPPVASFTAECHGFDCTFNASGSSDPEGGSLDYDWDFGDGTTGTGQTASRTYRAHGTYNVTLTVTDDDWMTGSVTQEVKVGRIPVASFFFDCASVVCVFTSTSTDPDNDLATWNWNFGDNRSGTGTSVTHTYPSAGTYTVEHTAIDSLGFDDSISQDVTVFFPPLARFSWSCEGLACTFKGSASESGDIASSVSGTQSADDGMTYAWTMGDGTSMAGDSVTHEYQSGGAYEVELTVTDANDQTASVSDTVRVNAPPTADFTANCSELACTFTSTSTDDEGIASHAWALGDGTNVSGESVSHEYAAAGSYEVVLTVTDTGGLTASEAKTVTVTDR